MDNINDFLSDYSYGQLTDSSNPIKDWKEIGIDGVEDMIVDAYIEELGSGNLTTYASYTPTAMTDASEISNIFDTGTQATSKTINNYAASFISNLTAAGYYYLLLERFIVFATVCENTRAEHEALNEEDIPKAFSLYITNILINYIVVKNSKQISATIKKIKREEERTN